MNNNFIYTDMYFSEQLKKFRFYRGYKKQAVLCKKLNISRQVWSLWELNKRKPTIPQLVVISNFLEVDMRYFFTIGAVPEDFDLTINRLRAKQAADSTGCAVDIYLLMPFVDTIASRQLFKVLDQCRAHKGIYTITVCADSGTSRSIREYYNLHPGVVMIMEELQAAGEKPDFFSRAELVIFDDADKLPEKMLVYIVTSASREVRAGIVLAGRKINDILHKNDLLDYVHEQFSIDCITTCDYDKIIKSALPNAGEIVLNYLRIETGMRLKRLAEIVKRVDKEKRGAMPFMLTINSLMKICNQI